DIVPRTGIPGDTILDPDQILPSVAVDVSELQSFELAEAAVGDGARLFLRFEEASAPSVHSPILAPGEAGRLRADQPRAGAALGDGRASVDGRCNAGPERIVPDLALGSSEIVIHG